MTLNTEEPGSAQFHVYPNQSDFSSPNRPDRLRGVLFRTKSGRGVRLATKLSLVPILILVELYLHDPMLLRGVYTDVLSFAFNIRNRSECLLTRGLAGF